MDSEDLIKHRDIRFRGPHELADQASEAARRLADLPGVLDARALSSTVLHLTYDIRKICIRMLLRHIQIEGFHLDNALLEKLRLALIEYAEDAQRGCLGVQVCPQPVRVNRPPPTEPTRPPHPPEGEEEHWRHYL
ncbi:MAG: hypothetical protein ACOC00_01980 [Halothiobacillaceae bacterium]